MKPFALFLTLFTLTCSFLAAENGDAMPPRDSLWQTVIMITLAMLFFYLIAWRPEQKRRKALEEQRSSIKKGDRVVAMGIVGTVVRIQDQTVILKMFDGSKIEVLKGAITEVNSGTEEDQKKAEQEDSK